MRDAAGDGLAAVKDGVGAAVEDLVAAGLRPRRHARAKEVDLGGRAAVVLDHGLGEALAVVYELDVLIDACTARNGGVGVCAHCQVAALTPSGDQAGPDRGRAGASSSSNGCCCV